jgi:hypothetical protein
MKWTDAEKEVVLLQYNKATKEELLDRLPGRTWTAIKSKANRYGLQFLFSSWSVEEETVLRNCYGITPIRLFQKLLPQKSYEQIRYRAHQLGLKADPKRMLSIVSSKYSADTDFFDAPTNLNSYWAGFIAADGCVKHDKGSLLIDLAIKDYTHLLKFSNSVKYTGKVRIYRNVSKLEIHGMHKWMYDLKTHFNIIPRKSLILEPPSGLGQTASLAFIIGYIDGDGDISVYLSRESKNEKVYVYSQPTLGIAGTKSMLSWIRDIFDKILGVQHCGHFRQRKSIYELVLKGKNAIKIVDYLNKIDLPKLHRKWGPDNLSRFGVRA